MKKGLNAVSILLCALLLLASCGGGGDGPPTPGAESDYIRQYYSNPVASFRFCADPSVIRHEGVYYAFVTGFDSRVLKSVDLVNWELTDCKVLAEKPTWGTTVNPNVWAPDIVKVGDNFIMYYSLSRWNDENPGIGYAVAKHPLGPWEDKGKLFLSNEIGVNNSIDPCVFKTQEGKLYMFWGSFRGIYAIELTSDGMGLEGGIEGARANKVRVAGLDTEEPWNAGTYEASYVIYRNDYYYLFLSTGLCCEKLASTYEVRVGRSKDPLGPYVDSLGRDMRGVSRGHLVVTSGNGFVGPGHISVAVDDAGEDWMLYHSWQILGSQSSEYRVMMVDKLLWDENGWPYLKYNYPSAKNMGPSILKSYIK